VLSTSYNPLGLKFNALEKSAVAECLKDQFKLHGMSDKWKS
jgi:hypothetical protein